MKELDKIEAFLRSTDGVNQRQRALPAQHPDTIRIDERKKSDILDFLKRLSEQINFFDLNNQAQGNWLPFFENLGQVSSIRVKAATTENIAAIYHNGTQGVNARLTGLSNGTLPDQDGESLASGDLLLVWKQENPIENGVYIITQGSTSRPFYLQRSHFSGQSADFNGQLVAVSGGQTHARRLFTQQALNPVVGTTEILYQRGGTSSNQRSPDRALLLAFLHLYQIQQQDINRLTGRHLAFYYENVLQMQRKKAIADKVHAVFELNRNADPVRLPAGTLLDAGKTPEGLYNRHYALDNEIVASQAVVEALKSSYTELSPGGKKIVYKTEDATLVKSVTGTGFRPFGEGQLNLSPEAKTMTEAKIGFAIASPNFYLEEGERKVWVSLRLQASSAIPPANAYEISITGAEGWMRPSFIVRELSSTSLGFEISIPAAIGPVVAFDELLHGTGFATAFPVFRCELLPHAFPLETLSTFAIAGVDLKVEALGVSRLILQNDEALQDPANPVLPFGNQPLIQSNFYIGSPEIFSKSVKSLSLNLEWQDPPSDFEEHYRAYGAADIPGFGNNIFTSDLYLLAGKNWKTRLLFAQSLFSPQGTGEPRRLQVLPGVMEDRLHNSGYYRNPAMPEYTAFDPRLATGFVKLVLTGPTRADLNNLPAYAPFEGFGHKSFTKVYTRQAIALGQFQPPGNPPELPNEPYTPVLKSVSMDYTAGDSFSPSMPNGVEQFFSLDIFGVHELGAFETARIVPKIPENGALYIGMAHASPPQLLSMLFQISDGSAPGNILLRSSELKWSYMAGDQWKAIAPADIAEDSTNGLQRSGLVRLTLGADATSNNTSINSGLYWLRLSAEENADGAGNFEAIQLQAAAASLVQKGIPESSMVDLLSKPLPPNSISKLVNKISGIKKVRQDYASVRGQPPETDDSYYQRVSERTRHRNRTVSGWDYERMVLDRFPQVFKVKCLSHTGASNELAPGQVKMVIVPDFRKLAAGDPLQPRCNASLLRDISDYVSQQSTSPFVGTTASNPEYETLLVDCKVSFMEGFDPGYYSAQLETEIKQFLSAWAYDEGKDITFGGKIYRNELLAFVEGRHYVDYVVDFKVYHRFNGPPPGGLSKMTISEDFVISQTPKATIGVSDAPIGGGFVVGQPVEVARASRADSILVSNGTHRIRVIQSEDFLCTGDKNIGIGQMIVKVNFIVQ